MIIRHLKNWTPFRSRSPIGRPTRRRLRRRSTVQRLEPRVVLATGEVLISEFLAVNDDLLRDYDDNDSDWIELRNDSNESVDLKGWYLTDDQNDLTKKDLGTVLLKHMVLTTWLTTYHTFLFPLL